MTREVLMQPLANEIKTPFSKRMDQEGRTRRFFFLFVAGPERNKIVSRLFVGDRRGVRPLKNKSSVCKLRVRLSAAQSARCRPGFTLLPVARQDTSRMLAGLEVVSERRGE
jgi:hypothetical protein